MLLFRKSYEGKGLYGLEGSGLLRHYMNSAGRIRKCDAIHGGPTSATVRSQKKRSLYPSSDACFTSDLVPCRTYSSQRRGTGKPKSRLAEGAEVHPVLPELTLPCNTTLWRICKDPILEPRSQCGLRSHTVA